MENIHATAVDIKGSGVLILGDSGSGKSDLALRLIENKGAVLVSDDRVNITVQKGKLLAFCPENIEGLLEVRGIGIVKTVYKKSTGIKLVVVAELGENVERFPAESLFEKEDVCVERIFLDLHEPSAPDKIVVKLKAVLEREKEKL